VTETYPDLRFITSFNFEDKPHLTWSPAFPRRIAPTMRLKACKGVFSHPTPRLRSSAKKLAAELLGKTAKPGSNEFPVADLSKPLLGKEMTMRYAERVDLPPTSGALADSKQVAPPAGNDSSEASNYSIVSHELKVKIVGVTDLDPDSMRGPVRARVLLPLNCSRAFMSSSPPRFAIPPRHPAKFPPMQPSVFV